jgi:LysM repeat protein
MSSFLASQQKKHVVGAKETLYGLSKKYHVTIDEIKKANPQLNKRTPQIGETLIIPDKNTPSGNGGNTPAPTPAAPTQAKDTSGKDTSGKDSEYIYVTIEPKQTLYGLSKKYKTTIETIRKLNPKMDASGPKIGEVLKIPANSKIAKSSSSKKEKTDKKKKPEETSEPAGKNIPDAAENTKDVINVVLLLPFHTETTGANAERNIATEFYSGAKLALDSLSNRGKKIRVNILDSGNENKLKETLDTYDFSDTDLIIGPLFKSGILTVADKITKIPIVSPFSSSDELDDHENIIIYDTKEQILAEKLVDEIIRKYAWEKIYILYDDDHYKTALHFQSLILNKKSGAEIILTKDVDNIRAEQNLVTQEYNKIFAILASDKEALVSHYLDNITKLESNQVQPISLFYSSLFDNKKYEEKLKDLGLFYSDTNYVNEYGFNEQKTIKFYKKKYCNSPGRYAISGFDVTYDILSRIDNKGGLSNSIMKAEGKQLSNKYFFSRIKKNGAWANQGARIIQLFH